MRHAGDDCVAQAENGGKEKKETFFVNKFKMLLRLFSPSRRPVRPPFLKKTIHPNYAEIHNPQKLGTSRTVHVKGTRMTGTRQ